MGLVASFVAKAAPQYSVSELVLITVPFSDVTSLQILQPLIASHDVAAHAMNRNAVPKNSFLFIIFKLFHLKDTKTLFS